jgi:multicomponent Na+:H+ antiporter subunit D
MINAVPPAAVFFVGALIVPFLRGRAKKAFILLVPLVALVNLLGIHEGTYWTVGFLDYELVLGKVDRLSMVFAYIFDIISFIAILYALHVKDDLQNVAALVYAGAAMGVVFAGDLLSFFTYWEIMAVTAACLIWARRTKMSCAAGTRYILVHVTGGLILLAGIIMHVFETGSIEFGYMGLSGLGSYLMFIGFGINCAWPGLHMWLTDAYPESTVTGTIFLSAFTTKCAVYALARAYPGTESLIWIGAVMTCFPIFYAVIENDLRRVLSYSLVNQIGFMVVGVGIGTPLAINGAAAHAFADILFKALLFMSMGAVMYRTGKINATDLGGLYKSMPLTCAFCIVGAASISAFPLFSAFATKSMVMEAAAVGHMPIIWFMLLFASAGVFHHAGIKIPFFAFFSHDSGIRTKEAPLHMLLAMGLAAFLCIFIGVFPDALYRILPYQVDYAPYSAPHVVAQLQLLFFSALAFTLLILSGIYPAEMRAINLDADWLYRKGARAFLWVVDGPAAWVGARISTAVFDVIPSSLGWASRNPAAFLRIAADSVLLAFAVPERREAIRGRIRREIKTYPGDTVRHHPIGLSVLLATLFLVLYLVIEY